MAAVRGGFGPSETRCQQVQRATFHEGDGPATLVITIVQDTLDVPYGDYFSVLLQWEAVQARSVREQITLGARAAFENASAADAACELAARSGCACADGARSERLGRT